MPEHGLDEAARRIMDATHNDPLVPDETSVQAAYGATTRTSAANRDRGG